MKLANQYGSTGHPVPSTGLAIDLGFDASALIVTNPGLCVFSFLLNSTAGSTSFQGGCRVSTGVTMVMTNLPAFHGIFFGSATCDGAGSTGQTANWSAFG